MATYEELHSLQSNAGLLTKVETASLIAAHAIITEDGATANHANRLLWAKKASSDPRGMAKVMLPLVLAANKDASEQVIAGASDSAVQSNVDTLVDVFATGE